MESPVNPTGTPSGLFGVCTIIGGVGVGSVGADDEGVACEEGNPPDVRADCTWDSLGEVVDGTPVDHGAFDPDDEEEEEEEGGDEAEEWS